MKITDCFNELDNKMEAAAIKGGTDKQLSGNGYTPFYNFFFKHIANEPIRLLELGLGVACASLKMWEEYFPNAQVYGIDCAERCSLYKGRSTIIIGNLSNKEFLSQLPSKIGSNFDIIVDDAAHHVRQQRLLFMEMFPHVKSGGVYVVEDLGTSYLRSFGGGFRKEENMIEEVKNLVDYINRDFFRSTPRFKKAIEGPYNQTPSTEYPHPYEADIHSIYLCRSMAFLFKK